MGGIKSAPACKDTTGACFARKDGRCLILTGTYEKCSFKKEKRTWTHGVEYPYNPASSVEHEVMSRSRHTE